MSRPLRILVFLHSFKAGGVERVALRLAGAWAVAGCEVRIAMGGRDGPQAHEAPPGVALDVAAPFVLARRFQSLRLAAHLAAMVRRHPPDVLFCAGNTYAIVAVLARLLLGRNCPPIVCKISNSLDRRDFTPPMRWGYGLWLRLQTLFIDRFVGLAESMRPELSRTLKISDDRVDIIYDPALKISDVPSGAVRSAAAPDGRLFVAVGRLSPQKDFDLLIRAFALAPAEGDRLVILGEGPLRLRLERLARRLGVAHRVDLPGYVAEVDLWLSRADALVLSSRYEGVPAVVIEALAQGVPIIATDCCVSMRDLLGAGAFGQVVPVGDAGALAAAMAGFDRRPYDVGAMRRSARAFTVERAAPRYLRLMAGLRPSAHLAEAVVEA